MRGGQGSHLAPGQIVDVPGVLAVGSLLVSEHAAGSCSGAVRFRLALCLSGLREMLLQHGLAEGRQWESRAMVPGIKILAIVALHHLNHVCCTVRRGRLEAACKSHGRSLPMIHFGCAVSAQLWRMVGIRKILCSKHLPPIVSHQAGGFMI